MANACPRTLESISYYVNVEEGSSSPLKCPVCDMNYASMQSMRGHFKKIHAKGHAFNLMLREGMKPFLCDICKGSFRTKRHRCLANSKSASTNVSCIAAHSIGAKRTGLQSDLVGKETSHQLNDISTSGIPSMFDEERTCPYSKVYRISGFRCVLVPNEGDGYCLYRAICTSLGMQDYKGLKLFLRRAIDSTMEGEPSTKLCHNLVLKGQLISEYCVTSVVGSNSLNRMEKKMDRHDKDPMNRGNWPTQNEIMLAALVLNVAIITFIRQGNDSKYYVYVEKRNGKLLESHELKDVIILMNCNLVHYAPVQTIPSLLSVRKKFYMVFKDKFVSDYVDRPRNDEKISREIINVE